jgi:hypothetical protein
MPSVLIGNWKTETIKTEWGQGVLEVGFASETDLVVKFLPVEGNEALISKGKYQLNGNKLSSEAINKGEPVIIALKKESLVIEIPGGEVHSFTRR